MMICSKNQQGKYNLAVKTNTNKYLYVFLGDNKPKEWDDEFILNEFIVTLIENYKTILDSYDKYPLETKI